MTASIPILRITTVERPLSWAAGEGNEGIAETLLANDRVDPDSKDNDSRTPLSWAAGEGERGNRGGRCSQTTASIPILRITTVETSLSWAAWMGHEEVVKLLVGD